jgi:hypothetical protein
MSSYLFYFKAGDKLFVQDSSTTLTFDALGNVVVDTFYNASFTAYTTKFLEH